MKKVVIIIDNSLVQDVLVDTKEDIEFLVVDFDRQSLDQSVANLLTKPYEFGDFAALADIYSWDGVYDPKRVAEIFGEKAKLYGVKDKVG